MCCDTRRAVLIVNVWALMMAALYVFWASLGIFIPDQFFCLLILVLVEIPLVVSCIWGAHNFVLWPIQTNMVYLGIKFFVMIGLWWLGGRSYALTYIPGIILLYVTHDCFNSEVQEGLLRKETYHQESAYCCCYCPSAVNTDTSSPHVHNGVEFTVVGPNESIMSTAMASEIV